MVFIFMVFIIFIVVNIIFLILFIVIAILLLTILLIIMKGLRYSGYIYVFDEDDDDVAGLVLKEWKSNNSKDGDDIEMLGVEKKKVYNN